jgi:hypothetical protein
MGPPGPPRLSSWRRNILISSSYLVAVVSARWTQERENFGCRGLLLLEAYLRLFHLVHLVANRCHFANLTCHCLTTVSTIKNNQAARRPTPR